MKEYAIKENHLFIKAYTKGSRYITATAAVYVLRDYQAGRIRKENPEKKFLNRIGFAASTKLGNAVTRNRCKRVLRAAYRAAVKAEPLKTGHLVVIAARSGATTASSASAARDLTRAFRKLGLIGER